MHVIRVSEWHTPGACLLQLADTHSAAAVTRQQHPPVVVIVMCALLLSLLLLLLLLAVITEEAHSFSLLVFVMYCHDCLLSLLLMYAGYQIQQILYCLSELLYVLV